MEPWVVGIDLGATKIRLGLVSPQDTVAAVRQIPTEAHLGPGSVVERMAAAVDELAAYLPDGQQLTGLGLCSPGPVDHNTGMLLDPPNLQGLHHTPLRDLLAARLGLPIVIEHDAKAAALLLLRARLARAGRLPFWRRQRRPGHGLCCRGHGRWGCPHH